MVLSNHDDPRLRKRVITIRHATPSRRKIVVIITQSQDPLGNWMVPLIMFEGFTEVIIESGRFARDTGIALLVAAYLSSEWMRDVPHENLDDLSDDDG
jgi:hypothetical protein